MGSKKVCIYCKRDDHQVPLVKFRFKGEKRYICSEHLPFLIHEPDKLAGKLPMAEELKPSEHED